MKFKKGDVIGAIAKGGGLTEAIVLKSDKKYYYCRIVNGVAKIPVVAEDNYKIVPKVYLR